MRSAGVYTLTLRGCCRKLAGMLIRHRDLSAQTGCGRFLPL